MTHHEPTVAPDAARAINLRGKVAIVTGASSGIGTEIARAIAEAGAAVVLAGRDAARLERASGQIRDAGGTATVAPVDLLDVRAPQRLVGAALDAFDRIDVLIHSAGVFRVAAAEHSLALLDEQWQVNVRAPYALTIEALPHLHEGASVIFISSVAGRVGIPELSAYSATKGAIELISRSLAAELGPKGIRVNAIAPGTTRTPMNEHLLADPEQERGAVAQTPLRRLGAVVDIAPLAVLLASDDAAFITGQSIAVDGGLTAT